MTINQDAINAAINKLPKPAFDSQYLNEGLDLIKQGKALVDPIGGAISSLTSQMSSLGSHISSSLGIGNAPDPSNPQGSLDSLISEQLFGGLQSGIESVASIGASVASVTSKMFTDIHPFSGRMNIPDNMITWSRKYVKLNGDDDDGNDPNGQYLKDAHGNKVISNPNNVDGLGVPQVTTLFNVTASQQALDAALGRNQDNPCSSFMDGVSGMIASVKETIGEVQDWIGGIVDDINGMVSDVISGAQSAIGDIYKQIRETVGDIIDWTTEGIAQVKAMIGEAISGAQEAIGLVFDTVSGGIADAISAVQDVASDVIGTITDTAAAIVEQVQAGFASMIKSLSSMNPCAQDVIIGENSVLTQDMSDLVRANMPPGSEIPF